LKADVILEGGLLVVPAPFRASTVPGEALELA